MELIDRFMAKVDKNGENGCWLWIGKKDREGYGYGYLCVNGRNKKAHRLSYELFVDSIPGEVCVYHNCGNHLCVNPNHLFLGTDSGRLTKKIKKNEHSGCWEWTGSRKDNGYGVISINNHQEYTHRLSYKLFVGEIPDGLCVLHRCDNPPCINPCHLFLGTKQDNIQDCLAKGRANTAFGERNGRAKLTLSQVHQIREDYRNGGVSQRELARRFNIGKSVIGNITRNESWVEETRNG
jgi:hypothetical protein